VVTAATRELPRDQSDEDGRDRDGEQRESVEAQIDHWLAF